MSSATKKLSFKIIAVAKSVMKNYCRVGAAIIFFAAA
jgi:hypothetical protein